MKKAVIALGIAVLVAAVARFVILHSTQEPPNYTQIEPGLWLGGNTERPPPATQAVLNLCELPDPYQIEFQRWEPTADAPPAPSLEWLRDQVHFVETQRAAGRVVYVHCQNGVSRSGMVVAAYLMAREQWTRDQALSFLRSRRPGVRPHPVFMDLLLEWERRPHDRIDE